MSTSRSLAICMNVSIGGYAEFVHHFETVVGATPRASANHLFDFCFSASITLTLLIGLSIVRRLIITQANILNIFQKAVTIQRETS